MSAEDFKWFRIEDPELGVIGVQRTYKGRDFMEKRIPPFVEWYFVDPAELDGRGKMVPTDVNDYDHWLALHEGEQMYLW